MITVINAASFGCVTDCTNKTEVQGHDFEKIELAVYIKIDERTVSGDRWRNCRCECDIQM